MRNGWILPKTKTIARITAAVGLLGAWLLRAAPSCAQNNYEIQVYGSELVAPGNTMVELHSNFTFEGSTSGFDGMLPTNHQLHETVEITHGFNDWFETGFYIFTAAQSGVGWQWVGDHIRPRFAAPKKWNWPVGVSISQEIGYQRRQFSADTWTYELRPIIDKQMGRWYVSFNPAFDKSIHGPSAGQGFVFSPDVKISYDLTSKVTGGIEYYGSLGPALNPFPIPQQEHQIFPTLDLNVSPKWEINTGLGFGLTRATDHLILKGILGYRFDF
jgi:hypothetical protein